MSREIKFRAWDTDRNKMFNDVIPMPRGNGANIPVYDQRDVSRANWIVGDSYSSKSTMWEPLHLPNVEIMQYTGLKDKNGVEIYEGDIVKCMDIDLETFDNWVVKLDIPEASFCLKIISKKDRSEYPFADLKFYEVIGNIYENPELLEVV